MRFLSLARRNSKEIYRDPITILLGIVMPVAFLLLFTSIYKKTQFEIFSAGQLTPGIIIFSYSFLMMFSATLLAKDRQKAFLMRLFTTPLKPVDFILGYMTPFLPLALILILVCFLAGSLLGGSFLNLHWIILVLFLVAVFCISLGMMLGSLFSVSQVSAMGSIVITMASLFGNIWTPLDIMGGVFQKVGYALPFAHAMDACRWLVAGNDFSGIMDHFLWVLGYALVVGTGGVAAFWWRTKAR